MKRCPSIMRCACADMSERASRKAWLLATHVKSRGTYGFQLSVGADVVDIDAHNDLNKHDKRGCTRCVSQAPSPAHAKSQPLTGKAHPRVDRIKVRHALDLMVLERLRSQSSEFQGLRILEASSASVLVCPLSLCLPSLCLPSLSLQPQFLRWKLR